MNRELALKDVLVLAGLLFVAAVYPESERLKSERSGRLTGQAT
jgi:hypothetical protein